MLRTGIYELAYRQPQSRDPADAGKALAILRDGVILGSDKFGGVFSGSYMLDPATQCASVRLKLAVPPSGELVTGYVAGAEAELIEIVADLDELTEFVADVGGVAIKVSLSYLGPLPVPALRTCSGRSFE